MYKISSNNIIQLNRGDSFAVPLFINIGSSVYPIRFNVSNRNDWSVYFGVMECNQKFEDAIIKKTWTKSNASITPEGDLIVKLEPDDTMLLCPGMYFYQVRMEYQTKDGQVESCITPLTQFWIMD